MSETKRMTEDYWGSRIDIVTEQQTDGHWQATATVASSLLPPKDDAPLIVSNQPTQQAATAAARSLATGSVDAHRITQGKP